MTPNRVVLITGCSSPDGIGFATARALARTGYTVRATVRDHSHDDQLLDGMDGRLEIHDLDVRDPAGIEAVVNAVSAADGRLDVLINNAGYGLIGGVEQVDLDRARASFETNFFGTMALIQAALETAAQALAVEIAPWNVRVTHFQPGPVMTSLSREWETGSRARRAEWPSGG